MKNIKMVSLFIIFFAFVTGAEASVLTTKCSFNGRIDVPSIAESSKIPGSVVFLASGFNDKLATDCSPGTDCIGHVSNCGIKDDGYYRFDKSPVLAGINFSDKTLNMEFNIGTASLMTVSGTVVPSGDVYFLYSVDGRVMNVELSNFSKHNLSQSYGGLVILELNKNLGLGMSDDDIALLQSVVLNTDKETKVSETGAGSPGKETRYFGSKTKQAVIRFQKKHGIVPATGFVGPLTREYINKGGYSY